MSENEEQFSGKAKRQQTETKSLRDHILTQSTGESSENISESLQAAYYETIYIVWSDIKRKLHDINELLTVMSSINYLDFLKLKPFFSLGIITPSTKELVMVKSYLEKRSFGCFLGEIAF